MKNLFLYICLSFSAGLWAQNTPIGNLAPIGQWQTFNNYNRAIDVVEAENSTFIANNFGLLEVREEYEQIFHTKVTGLSDVGIARIAYNKNNQVLIIAYTNGNIDLYYPSSNSIVNVPSILQNENIIGSKIINHIYTKGDKAYFACNFGLVEFNLSTKTFGATTITGANNVAYATFDNEAIYMATDLGLFKGLLDGRNLQDINLWELQGLAHGLPLDAYTSKTVFASPNNDKLFADVNDTLFAYNYSNNTWEHIPVYSTEYETNLPYCKPGPYEITRLNLSYNQDNLYVITGTSAYYALDLASANFVKHYYTDEQTSIISNVASDKYNKIWLAGLNQLYKYSWDTGVQPYIINSPANDNASDIIVDKGGTMWMTCAPLDYSTLYFSSAGYARFNRQNWKNFNKNVLPSLEQFYDAVTLAVDPTTGDVFVGSFMAGIAHMKGDSLLAIYDKDNTSNGLQPVNGDALRTRITALEFDSKGNCWIANALSTNPLVVRKKDGTWQNFSVLSDRTNMYQIAIDRNNYKWIATNNGVFVFDEGDMANNNDNKSITLNINNSVLPSNQINTVKADRNGTVWVGTDNGLVIFSCGNNIFTNGCRGSRPIVTVDGFNSYVMAGEEINDIAVDGANQKWLATNNGVFLLSPDGYTREEYFTVENSPLPSNIVKAIAVDEVTGMVYMSTEKGVVGYRGGATKSPTLIDKNNVLAFPNPVTPDYTGEIGIKGLPQDANIKITDITGKLVHETKAYGGQAVWDGYDYTGRRTASGVYLVFAVTSDGQQKLATKIVFIK